MSRRKSPVLYTDGKKKERNKLSYVVISRWGEGGKVVWGLPLPFNADIPGYSIRKDLKKKYKFS